MIACMIAGQPEESEKHRTTLIVAPAALCRQWMLELSKHAQKGIFEEIILYRAENKLYTNDIVKSLQRYSVIVTTYHELLHSYPKCEPPLHLTNDAARFEWWKDKLEETKGPLHHIFFHRVVLDEAVSPSPNWKGPCSNSSMYSMLSRIIFLGRHRPLLGCMPVIDGASPEPLCRIGMYPSDVSKAAFQLMRL